jgi:tripartite-type tricarboxylate transporter receptor subunit TctC
MRLLQSACVSVVGALLLAASPVLAVDAPYPVRPLRIVTGFPPGGNTDIIARAMAQKLTERLGQQVIVENRPGAGSMIGTDYVAKATPDGYTLLLVSGAVPTQAAVLKKLPFDPLRDFAWITNAMSYPFAVIVRPNAPMKSIPDLIALARKAPGKLNYASVGVGSVLHLAAELFDVMAAIDMTHIPYKGGAEPMTELIGGRIDVVFDPLTNSYPHLQSGRIRALAVTSLERSALLPGLPTVAQTLPGYEVASFSGFAAPRGTPRERIARLNRDMHAALAEPDMRKRFTDLGGTVAPTTPDAFGKLIASDIAKWKKISTARNIVVQ